MCHLWAKRTMACGHVQEGRKFQACETFNAVAICYEIYVHGANEAGPYCLGDPDCLDCNLYVTSLDAMDDLYHQAVATVTDDQHHAGIENARVYILSLDYLDWTDTFLVHQNLMKQYIDDGSVMDVEAAIRQLGYSEPSMPNPFQHGDRVIMTQEEKERLEVGENWDELSISSSDSDMDENSQDNNKLPSDSAKDNEKDAADGCESPDDYGFWEEMEIANDTESVLDRLEEEMDLW
ncbi:uncharacterized protein F4807DRAFT_461912 [Annulohypoxylon truncatum]|uniref:uncharacterized protein n=1 Tax=Annulohypoxylon truncatum TaxID=327061 RepID=UPI002007F16E|nr:uncharacterized protein F4807DRAFT_461912 [Annulohypoxylon truncatum]KAI1208186.1 hypothetical protein F4807DRAFT_461912 [Annulohypoxylon truncatum]